MYLIAVLCLEGYDERVASMDVQCCGMTGVYSCAMASVVRCGMAVVRCALATPCLCVCVCVCVCVCASPICSMCYDSATKPQEQRSLYLGLQEWLWGQIFLPKLCVCTCTCMCMHAHMCVGVVCGGWGHVPVHISNVILFFG